MTIADLEKQIADLDEQYQIDINAPTKTDMGFTIIEGDF